MGLFSFGKKVKLYAPVDGTLIDLATVAAGQTGFAVTPERHSLLWIKSRPLKMGRI